MKGKGGRPPGKRSPEGFVKGVRVVSLVRGYRQEGVVPLTDSKRWKSLREACAKLEDQVTAQGLLSKQKQSTRLEAGESLRKAVQRKLKPLKRMQQFVVEEYKNAGLKPPAKDAQRMTDKQLACHSRAIRAWAKAEGIDLNELAGEKSK